MSNPTNVSNDSSDTLVTRYAYPKYKVFIYGVEVTDDVVAITSESHDGASPNTCQITLVNELDRYTINTNDIVSINGLTDFDIAHLANAPWITRDPASVNTAAGTKLPTNTKIVDTRKKEILSKKSNAVYKSKITTEERQSTMPHGIVNNKEITDYFGTSISRFPITDGSPVFHSMDQVRVFMRDPFDPSRWYHYFTGFVSDMSDTINENNEATLTIVVEDPTKLLRYTRVFINPGVLDAKHMITNSDLTAHSFHANFFHGFTLPEVFFTLIFGPDLVGALDANKEVSPITGSVIKTKLRGIGHFSWFNSGIYTFGKDDLLHTQQAFNAASKSDVTADIALAMVTDKTELSTRKSRKQVDMETWQAIIDHEVQPSDLYSMAYRNDTGDTGDESNIINLEDINTFVSIAHRRTDNVIDIESVINYIGTDTETYPVDAGRLLMLIPGNFGTDNKKVVVNDIIQAYPMNSEWKSAGSILYDISARVQFSMYCTPRGDIVVEFPLYDFDPDDFGVNEIPSAAYQSMLNAIGDEHAASYERMAPGKGRGPYSKLYTINKCDTITCESAFIDTKVYTMATCPTSIFQNYETLPNTSIIGKLTVISLPDLIPLYGARNIPLTLPGYIVTPEAAEYAARIALNKLNAEAHTVKATHLPQIGIGVNRPIYIEKRNCIATTKNITQTITWGSSGDMSTSLGLYATRVWDGTIDEDNNIVYTPIGGPASRALNYKLMYDPITTRKQIVADPPSSVSTHAGQTETKKRASKVVPKKTPTTPSTPKK